MEGIISLAHLDFGPTVADRFDPRSNALTPLRLMLALTVVVLHAWPLGGLGNDPLYALTSGRLIGGGLLAVAAFFGLSGFLLVESRQRQSRIDFAWRRARRILPAYWLAIGLGALLVGPWYVASAWLPFPLVGEIRAFFGQPFQLVNGSLWTLWPEITCYVVLACLPRRHLGLGLAVTLAAVITLAAAGTADVTHFSVTLVAAFVTGGLVRLANVRLPLSGLLASGGLALAFATVGTPVGELVMPAGLAYAAIWAAARLPLRLTPDFSYGTYVFAFPVTEALVGLGAADHGVLALALSAIAVTVPLAALSWFLVERRALRIRLGDVRFGKMPGPPAVRLAPVG